MVKSIWASFDTKCKLFHCLQLTPHTADLTQYLIDYNKIQIGNYYKWYPWLNVDTLLSRSKLDKRLNTLLICFWYISIWYGRFTQFRYDFLSLIIIWYTFECIKVYLIFFWVYQNCIKSEPKQGVQFWSSQKCVKVKGAWHFEKLILLKLV